MRREVSGTIAPIYRERETPAAVTVGKIRTFMQESMANASKKKTGRGIQNTPVLWKDLHRPNGALF